MVNIFANKITDLFSSIFLDCSIKNCYLKYTNGMAWLWIEHDIGKDRIVSCYSNSTDK